MTGDVYKKIKRQNGETFARCLRDYHGGLLEIEGLAEMVRHAGRDATPLLPYLMTRLAANDDASQVAAHDPFALLEQAGYEAFYADTLEKQNSIKTYFKPHELLCTFNDAARYQKYHIVHAVKKDVDTVHRHDFAGREAREDAYGTSVISIQMLKTGGFISIKNRYNHTVRACDNTFDSNPDNIIAGLSNALKNHFKVDFSAAEAPLPDDFVLMGGKIFKYHTERNNIYFGDQAWAENGVIHAVDRGAGDALFDGYLFDNKTKTLKNVAPNSEDSFPEDFNRDYGGERGLQVVDGNLTLRGDILMGADGSRLRKLYLPALTTIGNNCLREAESLISFEAPVLTDMKSYALAAARSLTVFKAPALTEMGMLCLSYASGLAVFEVPALKTMGAYSLRNAKKLTTFHAPALTTMGPYSLGDAVGLTEFTAPVLTVMADYSLSNAESLRTFTAPMLTDMGSFCLREAVSLTEFDAPSLTVMAEGCLSDAAALTIFVAPALTRMGQLCLRRAMNLRLFVAPALTDMGGFCLSHAKDLTTFEAPALTTAGEFCLSDAKTVTTFKAPVLTNIGKQAFAGVLRQQA